MEQKFIFISYCSKDVDVANSIVDSLEKQNIKCFIAPRDINPGAIFAEEIVNAISNCFCCLLLFSKNANNSNYVLKEVNSAVNHNTMIIPVKIDKSPLSNSFDFYLGTTHWINLESPSEHMDYLVKSILNVYQGVKESKENKNIFIYRGPIVLDHEKLESIGYDAKKRVLESIEIDYLTLSDSIDKYKINDQIEGTMETWIDYATDYPDTVSGLIVDDKMIGYSQIELVNKDNFNSLITGQKIADQSMEEMYAFGGSFYCYIVIMPIIKAYENMNNYLLLFNDFFAKMVRLTESGINIKGYAISVYSHLLESMVKSLGFVENGINPAGGKIFVLSKERIKESNIIENKYPSFYEINIK